MQTNHLLKKGLVVGIILLFFGVIATPGMTVSAANERTEQSVIHLCGLNGNNIVALTARQAAEVNVICEKYQPQMEKASSAKEAESILSRALIELTPYGLFEGTNLQQAQHFFRDNRVTPRTLVHARSFPGFFSNICCFLTGTIPWTYEMETGKFPAVWPLSLPFIFSCVLMAATEDRFPFLELLSVGIAALCFLQPLKVINFVVILDGGVIHSVGLKGIVDTQNTLALLGYTGLIIIQPKLDKVTFMGFTLAMVGY